MNRATKLLVACWVLAAIAAQLWLVPALWPGLKTHASIIFLVAAALTSFNRRFVGLVLLVAYFYPVLIYSYGGRYHVDYDMLWLAALAGAVMPDALRTPWRVPSVWRAPLVLWALTLAIGATVVVFREMDFYPGVLRLPAYLNSTSGGGGPAFVSIWLLDVSVAFIVGILWFDWLFGAGLDFHRDVATPLMISSLALAAVSIYQLLFDFQFLNYSQYAGLGRASGTMFDANVSGNIAAFWTGGSILWASRLRRRRVPTTVVLFVASWLAVWSSGSRGAFGLALVSTIFSALAFREPLMRAMGRRKPWQLAAAGVVAVAVVWMLNHSTPQVVGPLSRVIDTLPSPSVASVRQFGWEMWDRNRYGSVAASMIRRFPLFGIGIGCFHLMIDDFAAYPLIADNAQNWYRHQLAELGVVGSLGWIAWVVLFGWYVLKPPARAPAESRAARGMLVGFGLVSLIGMPSQAVAVSFTVWTAAFWYISIVGAPPSLPLKRSAWAVVVVIALIFSAGTIAFARTSLRVASRAQRVGFPYSYGFYYPEPDGQGGEYRWARQRASTVVEANGPVVALSMWVNHRDIATNPVDAKLWCDNALVLGTRLATGDPVTAYVQLPAGERRTIVDSWVSRVVHPKDLGVDDNRELGLMVRWSFVDSVPAGLTAIDLR